MAFKALCGPMASICKDFSHLHYIIGNLLGLARGEIWYVRCLSAKKSRSEIILQIDNKML